MPMATIWSRGGEGETIQIYLEKTGSDQALIRIAAWARDRNPSVQPPQRLHAYTLYAIRAADGAMVCKADLPGPFDPTVGCRFEAVGEGGGSSYCCLSCRTSATPWARPISPRPACSCGKPAFRGPERPSAGGAGKPPALKTKVP
ncbi:hypothetical protein K9U40_21500 [Xanthobacter autotrophicus]|uniref:hypothetical protein n=1 Tax=Xanthobacter TaxID=279 RepID=UPI0024AC0694|nr:hypothetical protein [Xanthobacter autotrophicus]MDI4666875.1 hypothetical protein [Xanthobacter autotrophicus]